jgi:2-hydroxyacyl-CoA lyase 1
VGALLDGLKGFKCKEDEWVNRLKTKAEANIALNEQLIAADPSPMTHYSSMGTIRKFLPKEHILVGEGASTMDIGRTIFGHEQPRRKLDAATFGTMGIGLSAVIAAQSAEPNLWTVAVMGDSAFGFSAMECETLTRYQMGAAVFIINNNGINSGLEALEGPPREFPVTSLNPEAHYEKMAEAFGGRGYEAKTVSELSQICA